MKHWRRTLPASAAGLLAAASAHAHPVCTVVADATTAKGPRKLAFAYLIQDGKQQARNVGLRARDTFLDALPARAEPARPQ